MTTMLVIIGILLALVGFVGSMANQLTGVGLAVLACFCILLARVSQASAKSTSAPAQTVDRHNQPAA